ncbi:PqiB family protein [Petrachloros mirabilis]
MPDAPSDMDFDDLPEAQPSRKRGWTVQFVWIVPIVAALIGGWLVVKGILDKGPVITIMFKTADGLEAGKTKVKYKNVDIGEVKQVTLSKDRQGIVTTVELVKDAESYLVDDTKFWVVRPRVAGGQVSGLGTLFSGSYIGLDIGKSTTKRRDFIGLEVAPIVTGDVPGRHFTLRAETLGSLEVGSPVFYRQEAVGRVVAHGVNEDGRGVTSGIFIEAPYDQYVNANTRFWNASGIDVTLDASGVKVDTQSLASILIGGVAFANPVGSGPMPPVEENHEFVLAETRADAMKREDMFVLPFVFYFTQSLRGLSVGAPVDFHGIVIGEVKSMNLEADPSNPSFRFPVGVEIYPGRLVAMMAHMPSEIKMDEESRRARWDQVVANGLRGQLRTGNLLTGQLYIAVDFFPDAPQATVDWTHSPPILPTVPGTTEEIQATISHLAKTAAKLPLDEIGSDIRKTLKTLNRTLESGDAFIKHLDADVTPAAKAALQEARQSLKAVEKTLSEDSPTQQELQETLKELRRTAQSMRLLSDYLERHPEALIRGKKEGGR